MVTRRQALMGFVGAWAASWVLVLAVPVLVVLFLVDFFAALANIPARIGGGCLRKLLMDKAEVVNFSKNGVADWDVFIHRPFVVTSVLGTLQCL